MNATVDSYAGGYDWAAGKSRRAVEAESRGLVTASTLARRHKVSASAVAAVMEPVEWHHTSKLFNRTWFYDPHEVTPALVEAMREFDRKRADEKAPVIWPDCTVGWIEWAGTRRRPVPIKKKAEHVVVESVVNGSFLPRLVDSGCATV